MEVYDKQLKLSSILFITVALIPLWWILGVKIAIFHIVSFVTVIIAFNKKGEKRIGKLLYWFIGAILVYAITILFALINNPLDAKMTTVLAQIYILSYWIMGVFVVLGINLLDKINSKFMFKILKGFVYLGIATVIVFLVSVILWKIGVASRSMQGLLSVIWPDNLKIDMFEEMMQINYSVLDVIYNEVTGIKQIFFRFNGFYVYPTEGAMATLIILAYSLLYFNIKRVIKFGKDSILDNKWFQVIYLLILSVAIYYFRSRTIILGSFISLIVVYIIRKINKENLKKILGFAVAIAVGVLLVGTFSGIFDKLLNMRPGSNSVRLMVYQNTLRTFFENPFGVGIPFRIEGLEIPIGSHSTYLGVLMKGGIIGFIAIISLKIIMFIQVFKNKKYVTNRVNRSIWYTTTYVLVMSSMWMLIDDLDWTIIMAFFYFVNCSLIFKFKDIAFDKNEKKQIDNIKIGLVGSSGGHLTHLIQLKEWYENKERFWVTFNKADAISQLKDEKSYWCYYPTNRNIKNLIKNTCLAFKVILKERPDLIISSGAAVAIPFFYVGKLFGVKLIYIEVYDRIDSPTITGKIVYPICDEFIIQWEEQRKFYKKAKLLGGLF